MTDKLTVAKKAVDDAIEILRVSSEIEYVAKQLFDNAHDKRLAASRAETSAITAYVNTYKEIGQKYQFNKLIKTGTCMLNYSESNPFYVGDKFATAGTVKHPETKKVHPLKFYYLSYPITVINGYTNIQFNPPIEGQFCDECTIAKSTYYRNKYGRTNSYKPSKFTQTYIYETFIAQAAEIESDIKYHLLNGCKYKFRYPSSVELIIAEMVPSTT